MFDHGNDLGPQRRIAGIVHLHRSDWRVSIVGSQANDGNADEPHQRWRVI